MQIRSFFLSALLTVSFTVSVPGQVRSVPQAIAFEANQGQTDSSVKFLARAGNYQMFLTANAAVLALGAKQPQNLTIRLLNANRTTRMTGLDEQRGVSNYLEGSDPAKWLTGVKQYAKVRYEQVYPGVDLVYYGKERQLEHDFIVAPQADYRKIQIHFDGATAVRLSEEGDLIMRTPAGELRQRRPLIYQEIHGEKKLIAGGYRMNGRRDVSFRVDAYDPSQPLIIDPTFTYFGTYLGGSGVDQPNSIVTDAQGNPYITGSTSSLNFPVRTPAQPQNGGMTDVFVTKLNSATGAIIYSTYLGGSNNDTANQIKVDATGAAYIVGTTASSNFPVTTGAFQTTLNGPGNAFVAKLTPAGSALAYSTYLGGSGGEIGRGLDIDTNGNAYVVGMTYSTNFPIRETQFGLFANGGGSDGFMTEINPTGSALVYSSYLGGSGSDCLMSVAVNSLGEANVVGFTNSTDLPTTEEGSRWPSLTGELNGFMAKVSPGGGGPVSIEYISYYGGSNIDIATSIVTNPNDDVTVYISGLLSSPDFPTPSGQRINLAAGQVVPYVTEFQLPGLVYVSARPGVRKLGKGDNNPYLDTPPEDCQGNPWAPLLQRMNNNLKDYEKFNTILGDAGSVAADIFTPIIATIKDIIVLLKDSADFCTGSSSSSKALPALPRSRPLEGKDQAASPTPLYAINAADGTPVDIPQPPVGNPASFTTVNGVASSPSGNLYVAMQTNDTTLPVTAPGASAGTGPLTGYVIELSATPPPPTIASILNGASFANAALAPGSLVTLFGNFPGTTTASAAGLPLPASLGNTSVTINGLPAPLNFVDSTQVNTQIPWDAPLGAATAIVTSGGVASSPIQFTVGATAPGIFSYGANLAVAQNSNYSLNDSSTPAKVGSFVIVYMTGAGAVNPPVQTGAATPASPVSYADAKATATIGGQPADILFLGMAPYFVGISQADVKIPSLSPGTYPVVITVGGVASNGPLVSVSTK